MTTYTVKIGASKIGTNDAPYYEKRTYHFELVGPLNHWDVVRDLAIDEAYAEGLEHVRVENIVPLPPGHPAAYLEGRFPYEEEPR